VASPLGPFLRWGIGPLFSFPPPPPPPPRFANDIGNSSWRRWFSSVSSSIESGFWSPVVLDLFPTIGRGLDLFPPADFLVSASPLLYSLFRGQAAGETRLSTSHHDSCVLCLSHSPPLSAASYKVIHPSPSDVYLPPVDCPPGGALFFKRPRVLTFLSFSDRPTP